MRINDREIKALNEEIVVLPRPDDCGGNIVFMFRAVLDYTLFEKLVSEPQPPVIRFRNGKNKLDVDDAAYQTQLARFRKLRLYYIFLKSIEATEGLAFDKVNINDPETWSLLDDEMLEAGIATTEQGRLWQAVFDVNSLSDEKLDAAREAFLASRTTAQ